MFGGKITWIVIVTQLHDMWVCWEKVVPTSCRTFENWWESNQTGNDGMF